MNSKHFICNTHKLISNNISQQTKFDTYMSTQTSSIYKRDKKKKKKEKKRLTRYISREKVSLLFLNGTQR